MRRNSFLCPKDEKPSEAPSAFHLLPIDLVTLIAVLADLRQLFAQGRAVTRWIGGCLLIVCVRIAGEFRELLVLHQVGKGAWNFAGHRHQHGQILVDRIGRAMGCLHRAIQLPGVRRHHIHHPTRIRVSLPQDCRDLCGSNSANHGGEHGKQQRAHQGSLQNGNCIIRDLRPTANSPVSYHSRMSDPRFLGIDRLYGTGSVELFARSRVAVIGLGGVGSWAAEALARSGIGSLTLIDGDEICISNVNRQSHALEGKFGQSKADVLRARLQAINPHLVVDARGQFLTPAGIAALLAEQHDLILDACDAFRVKLELVAACRRARQPLIVVGSAGGRTDPTRVRVRDLAHTEHDKLLGMIRKKLRQDHAFPRNVERSFGVRRSIPWRTCAIHSQMEAFAASVRSRTRKPVFGSTVAPAWVRRCT